MIAFFASSKLREPLRCGLIWLSLGFVTSLAQAAAPAPDSKKEEGETIVLTPFEVTADSDTGYVGQDTLSGSRLRTNLRDIAAAISPMTAEFLSDIAAIDVESAMEYGVGTRIDTDDARAAGPIGDSYNDGIRSIRIRGLPGGGRSINFFGAPGEVDMYLADRLELSRGPNSILYGFGSPAGKVNIATKQAMTNRNAYSVSSRIDSWGGERLTADANLALLRNKLAVRALVLRGRDSSWRAAGHNDQDRLFLAAKWQLDRKTTLKVEVEHADINRFVPRPFFGVDLRSVWEASGRPIFNNFNANYVPGTPGSGAAGTPGNPYRDTGTTAVTGVMERTGGNWVVVSDHFPYAQDYRYFTTSESPGGSLLAADFEMGRRNPEAVLEANWVGGQWTNNSGSVFLQRELLPSLNIEAAFNRTATNGETRNLASQAYYGFAADTNKFLPNGQLKPAGDLYYIDVSRDYRPQRSEVNQARLAVSYEKTFGPLATLRAAGLGEFASSQSRMETRQQYWLKGPSLTSGGAFNPTPEASNNMVYYRYYIDDLSVLDDPNYRIPAPYALSGATKFQDPRTGVVSDIYMHEFNRAQGNINWVDRETGAAMGVLQAFLLKNRLVGTFGYRKDRLKNWVGLAVRDPAAEALAPNTGVWTPSDPRTAKPSVFSGQTRTLGGVVHCTSWLSLFYNTSSSLSTPGSNYITPTDPMQTTIADLVRSPSGKTKDFGIKLSLARGRLFLTGTRYETTSKDEFGYSGFNKSNIVNIWNALANSGALNEQETEFARRQAQVMNMVQGYMQDSQSKGYELEIVGQITPEWSVSLNYARNETTRTNMAREYRAYIDHHKAYWKQFKDFAISQNIANAGVEKAQSYTDWRTPEAIASTGDFTVNTDSINEAIADAEQVFFDNPHLFEGRRFVGDPLHNFNLRTRYSVRNGILKGVTIGAGMRMRRGRVAGARSDYSFLSGSDYTDTWNGRVIDKVAMVYAKDQELFDLQLGYTIALGNRKVRWDIQLNVSNLLDERGLIVNNTHPRTLEPLTYRYQDPRQYILTNTFSF